MQATSIVADATRIIPADKHKALKVTKRADGGMDVEFADGTRGNVADAEMQAFVVWTMINPELTK